MSDLTERLELWITRSTATFPVLATDLRDALEEIESLEIKLASVCPVGEWQSGWGKSPPSYCVYLRPEYGDHADRPPYRRKVLSRASYGPWEKIIYDEHVAERA